VARHDLSVSSDAAASRAYYAAFYAASALFALQGRSFAKHTALEAAVHRDLVRPGAWPTELGRGFSRLMQLRSRGDYGAERHVSPAEAEEAIRIAEDILRHVAGAHPNEFLDS
jgi:uncharacterized protein (UPF0332 family)